MTRSITSVSATAISTSSSSVNTDLYSIATETAAQQVLQQQQQSFSVADTTTALYMFSTLDDASRALILSLLAGLSTCLGAAVVFCLQKYNSKQQQQPYSALSPQQQQQQQQQQQLDPKYLAFSLSLAASVMVTVSLTSILPESISSVSTANEMVHRVVSFLLGCAVYAVLNKLLAALPEPPDVILLRSTSTNTTTATTTNTSNSPVQETKRNTLDNNKTAINSTISSPPTSKDTTASSSSSSSSSSSFKREARTLLLRRTTTINTTTTTTNRNASSDVESCLYETQQQQQQQALNTNKDMDCDITDSNDNNHNNHVEWESKNIAAAQKRAWRVTVLLFLSLAIHNFPEGLAVAASSLHSPALGGTTAVAIALHNIPEGIAIAIPCLAARPNQPWLAFWMASLSGLAEPLGAAVALYVLNYNNDNNNSIHNNNNSGMLLLLDMNNVLAFVAGIMMTVAILELFPEAMRQQRKNAIIPGAILGAVIMIASEAYLNG